MSGSNPISRSTRGITATAAEINAAIAGNGLSAAEIGVLDGVTPGTAAASKALVLDSSKGIATITSATITTLTTTTANVGGVLTTTSATVPTGGHGAAGGFAISPRNWHTGGISATTDFSDYTVVNTEVLIAEVFVPANATLTGVAIFNGSAVAGNIKVGLANSSGTVVATSASTAQSGTDAYQRVAFTGTYAAVGPATYYVLAIGDTGGGTSKINTHTVGNFGAAKQTGQVYATGFTTITPPTTFTTGLGPVASLY